MFDHLCLLGKRPRCSRGHANALAESGCGIHIPVWSSEAHWSVSGASFWDRLLKVCCRCSCTHKLRKRLTVHARWKKARTTSSRHTFGQRRQCNYNFVHGIIYLVSSVPSTNHMEESRLGKRGPPPWPRFKDNPAHYAREKGQQKKIKKTLAPHWFYTSDWLLSVRSFKISSTCSVLYCLCWVIGGRLLGQRAGRYFYALVDLHAKCVMFLNKWNFSLHLLSDREILSTLFSSLTPPPPSPLPPSFFMAGQHSPCLVSVMNSILSSMNKAPCNSDTPHQLQHKSTNCPSFTFLYPFGVFKQASVFNVGAAQSCTFQLFWTELSWFKWIFHAEKHNKRNQIWKILELSFMKCKYLNF